MRPCDEPLHRSHWRPLFQRPGLYTRVSEVATGYFLLSLDLGFQSLGISYDDTVWSQVAQDIDEAAKQAKEARAAMQAMRGDMG